MARWLNRSVTEADGYATKAAGIVRGLKEQLFIGDDGAGMGVGVEDVACDPPAPACYADGLNTATGLRVDHTSVQASLFMAGCGLLPPTEALQLLPFLKAKTATMPHSPTS